MIYEYMKMLRKYQYFFLWLKIRRGKKVGMWNKRAGYCSLSSPCEIKMESGKTMIAELVDYSMFRDPPDMIENSTWHFVGYKGETPFKNLDFHSFFKAFTGKDF